jgi:hypothetical protein
MLPRSYLLLSRNYYARNDAKAQLRNDEPQPVDPPGEQGIQEFDEAVDQS